MLRWVFVYSLVVFLCLGEEFGLVFFGLWRCWLGGLLF